MVDDARFLQSKGEDGPYNYNVGNCILGNDDSTEYKNRTRRFPFPQPGERKTYVGGSCLCQNPDCRVCAALPECLSVHYNCLVVFTSSCSSQAHNDATEDVMRRLWVLAASKTPWRGALPVFLPSASLPGAGGDSLRTAAALAKMPQLCTLPAELIRDIREYSPHALLWRCAAALELVRHVKDTVAAPLRVLRMADILFWTRGSEPEPVSPGVAPPPDGILRLRLRGKAAEYPPTIWNTPAPPVGPPSHCTYMSKPPPSWHRCFVAEAESICGITFFFSDFAVSAIHTHSAHSTDISATATAEYFSHRSKGAVAWLYVPIAKNDQLLALGFRRARLGVHILVRLKLAGDVVFGRSGIVPIGEAERDKVDIDDDDNDENKLWYSEYVFNEYDTTAAAAFLHR
ncbi:hypothetical protein SBRCBS47491_003502 [Sporothrix bragantina]|uniref:Uncharacterized protein n=1 Tax=Sporothrix bragantina TaxID=671064 RepID=A0ABP0BFX9_9PEZI